MLDRNVGLTCHQPENAADVPATRKTGIERQSPVNQRYHGTNVLAEMAQRVSGICQDARIIDGASEGTPSEISALQTIRRRIFVQWR
jgi:hypothetical protein